MSHRPLPRSAYATKLGEFPEFTFTDEAALVRRGRWREFFAKRIGDGFDGRVVLEIGCADATLLTTVAVLHPATAFAGLDWKCKPLYEGASRAVAGELRNIALLRARAQELEAIFAEAEVDEIWLFHPEPCEGEDERKNRLMSQPFLEQTHYALRDGAILALKTDHLEYYQSTLDLLGAENLPAMFRLLNSSSDYWGDQAAQSRRRLFSGQTTQYEQRFVKKRQPIYYLEIQKVGGFK